jgi:hypothetical protein
MSAPNSTTPWFLKNRNVLASEVRMLARALGDPAVTLRVGC